MKVIVAVTLVCALHLSRAGSPPEGVFASADGAIDQSTSTYQTFLAATANETGSCTSCSDKGCCPVIVRNCPPKWVGTVIQPFSGWRGNAAVIIDWGCTDWTACGCCPKGRICTVNDRGFLWYVDWGDGTSDHGYSQVLGPVQKTHQYTKSCQTRSYGVTFYYCSNPGCPSQRCCDSIYRVIDVSEDPSKPVASVDFNKPL